MVCVFGVLFPILSIAMSKVSTDSAAFKLHCAPGLSWDARKAKGGISVSLRKNLTKLVASSKPNNSSIEVWVVPTDEGRVAHKTHWYF
jgi:hypothetical protein